MTGQEIKLELSKIALANGLSVESAKAFYNWIEEDYVPPKDKQTPFDDTPIEELAERTRMKNSIIRRCRENRIFTIGDLIRCGGYKFNSFSTYTSYNTPLTWQVSKRKLNWRNECRKCSQANYTKRSKRLQVQYMW